MKGHLVCNISLEVGLAAQAHCCCNRALGPWVDKLLRTDTSGVFSAALCWKKSLTAETSRPRPWTNISGAGNC